MPSIAIYGDSGMGKTMIMKRFRDDHPPSFDKTARFPAYRDLNGFDFTSSEVNEVLVRQLHRCEFVDDANNIVVVGGPGTGKTHVATAFGVQAIEHHHKRVRFFSTVELVNGRCHFNFRPGVPRTFCLTD